MPIWDPKSKFSPLFANPGVSPVWFPHFFFRKRSLIQLAKTLKIAVVDNPTVVWCPCQGKPLFKFSWWALKTHVFWNTVRRSSKVVDFGISKARMQLLAISDENSDPAPIRLNFDDVPLGLHHWCWGSEVRMLWAIYLCNHFRSNPTYRPMTTVPQRYRQTERRTDDLL